MHADGVCAIMKLGGPHAMDSFAWQNYRGSDSVKDSNKKAPKQCFGAFLLVTRTGIEPMFPA